MLIRLAAILREFLECLWLAIVGPAVNDPEEPRLFRIAPDIAAQHAAAESSAAHARPLARHEASVGAARAMNAALEKQAAARRPPPAAVGPIGGAPPSTDVVASAIHRDITSLQEALVAGSFLSQLEQRTQQVKITLANLEAEKTRIEALINQIQPLVPQYDALLQAEHDLQQSQVRFEDLRPEPSVDADATSQEETVWENPDPQPEGDHKDPSEQNWER